MNKVIKIVGIVMASVLAVGMLIIGGYKVMKQIEHNEMVKIVKSEEVKKIIEDDLKEMDKFALTDKGKIKFYQIDEKSIKHNPMGGIDFEVYLNSNKSLIVYYGLEKNSETKAIEYSGGGYSKEVKELIGVKE